MTLMTTSAWVQVQCREGTSNEDKAALAGWLYSHAAGAADSDFSMIAPIVTVRIEGGDPLAAVREALQGCPYAVYESVEVL